MRLHSNCYTSCYRTVRWNGYGHSLGVVINLRRPLVKMERTVLCPFDFTFVSKIFFTILWIIFKYSCTLLPECEKGVKQVHNAHDLCHNMRQEAYLFGVILWLVYGILLQTTFYGVYVMFGNLHLTSLQWNKRMMLLLMYWFLIFICRLKFSFQNTKKDSNDFVSHRELRNQCHPLYSEG